MRLSVVVTVVDGGPVLDRCLTALSAQQQSPELEVIVPWDASIPAVGAIAERFPSFRFLALGRVTSESPAESPAGQHELYDRRRAAGLLAATGDVIAVLEDRGVPRPDWSQALGRLHQALPHAAIGGAIENGHDAVLNWAVYFCDFGRFQRPFEPGRRDWVSDINIAYKRRALDQTRELWRERYHETTVHWALQRSGETLYLSPEPIVDQERGALSLGSLLAERFAWGRLFAATRARESTLAGRMMRTLATPFLPVVLFARLAALQAAKRKTMGKFVAAAPAITLLLVVWSLGEAAGYVTKSRSRASN